MIYPSITPNFADTGVDTQMIGWHGKCEVHEKFTVDDIRRVREQFPDVVILAHLRECSPEVTQAADTFGRQQSCAMIRYVEQSSAPRYLILTECSMSDNIAAANPDKEMLRLCTVRCLSFGHERDHARRHAQIAPTQSLCDRSARGDSCARGAGCGADDRDWLNVERDTCTCASAGVRET